MELFGTGPMLKHSDESFRGMRKTGAHYSKGKECVWKTARVIKRESECVVVK